MSIVLELKIVVSAISVYQTIIDEHKALQRALIMEKGRIPYAKKVFNVNLQHILKLRCKGRFEKKYSLNVLPLLQPMGPVLKY